MKKYLMILLTMAACLPFAGCKDDKDSPDGGAVPSDGQLVGYWTGSEEGEDDGSMVGFYFKENGTADYYEYIPKYYGDYVASKFIDESNYYYDNDEQLLLYYYLNDSGKIEYTMYDVRTGSKNSMKLRAIGDDDEFPVTPPMTREKCESLIEYYANQNNSYAYMNINLTKVSKTLFDSWWEALEGKVTDFRK